VWDRLAKGWVNEDDLYFGINAPVTAGQAEDLARQAAIGQLEGAEAGEDEWVRRNAGGIIRTIEVTEQEPRPATELGYSVASCGYEAFPRALYRVVLTDPKWSSHMRAGMEWQTTAYVMEEA
jgi:hypothetical protein